MPVRNDFICTECGKIGEWYGKPDGCPNCGAPPDVMAVVFSEPRNVIAERASVVDHVIRYNQNRLEEQYEEDAGENSEYQKALRDAYGVTEEIPTHHVPGTRW